MYKDLADFLGGKENPETEDVQEEIYEAVEKHDAKPRKVFKTGYRPLLGRHTHIGPRWQK